MRGRNYMETNCPKCGKPLVENASYCGYCGACIKDPAPEPVDTALPVTESPEPVPDPGNSGNQEPAKPPKKRIRRTIIISLFVVFLCVFVIPLFSFEYAPNLVPTDFTSEGMCSVVTVDELCRQWNDLFADDELGMALWGLNSDSLYSTQTMPSGNIISTYSCLQGLAVIGIVYEPESNRVTEVQMYYSKTYFEENTSENNFAILVEKPCILASIISGISADTLIEKFSDTLKNTSNEMPSLFTQGLVIYFDEVSIEDLLATKIYCCTKEVAKEAGIA